MNYEMAFGELKQILEILPMVPEAKREEVFEYLFELLKESNNPTNNLEELLSNTVDADELKKLLVSKRANSNIERTLLFVIALNNNYGISKVTAQHVEFCYKACELTPPGNLTQNLRDACSKRYYYLTFVQDHYEVTSKGYEFYSNM